MSAPKRQNYEQLAIKFPAKSAAMAEEVAATVVAAGYGAHMFYSAAAGEALCLMSDGASGISRHALRPDRKLGKALQQLGLDYESVGRPAVDKVVRAYAADPDAQGLDPESAAHIAGLRRSKAGLEELERKGGDEWYTLQRRYLGLLDECQLPPVTFAGMVLQEGDAGGLLVTKNLEVLEKMYANHRKIKGDQLPRHSNLETLLQYCDDHPLEALPFPQSGPGAVNDAPGRHAGSSQARAGADGRAAAATVDPVEVVRGAGHYEIARAVADVVVGGAGGKVRTVWVHGAADSGKTTAIELVEEIFCAQRIQFQGAFLGSAPPNKPNAATQVVSCHELNGPSAFHGSNLANMKTMLEGRGGMVRNLYQAFSLQFAGCAFLFGSNGLPEISKEHLFPVQFRDDWGPIVKRCRFVHMAESFTGRTFGYDCATLAHCIKALLPGHDRPEDEPAVAHPGQPGRATAAATIIELEDLLEPAPVETALCLPQPA